MENNDHITPVDILHVKFDHSFRGYNQNQVDEFLDKLSADYEELAREAAVLKKENEALKEQMQEVHSMEQTMQKAMITAQKASENLIESTRTQVQDLKRKKDAFIMEFKNMLKTTLEYVEKMETKLDRHVEEELINEN